MIDDSEQTICGPEIAAAVGRWLTVTAKVDGDPDEHPLTPITETVPDTALTP